MNSPFPTYVPRIGDLVRVTPEKVDYVTYHYRYFCEEAYVTSRFLGVDYEGKTVILCSLGGRMLIEPLRFNLENQMCLTVFDKYDRIVNIEVVLE
jgi:hypothetical protein